MNEVFHFSFLQVVIEIVNFVDIRQTSVVLYTFSVLFDIIFDNFAKICENC